MGSNRASVPQILRSSLHIPARRWVFAEEGVDRQQLRGLAAREHEEQPAVLRRVGMARRADALGARTELGRPSGWSSTQGTVPRCLRNRWSGSG